MHSEVICIIYVTGLQNRGAPDDRWPVHQTQHAVHQWRGVRVADVRRSQAREDRWEAGKKKSQSKVIKILLIQKNLLCLWQPVFPACGSEPSLLAALERPSVPRAGRSHTHTNTHRCCEDQSECVICCATHLVWWAVSSLSSSLGWLGYQLWKPHQTHEDHPPEQCLPLCNSCSGNICTFQTLLLP